MCFAWSRSVGLATRSSCDPSPAVEAIHARHHMLAAQSPQTLEMVGGLQPQAQEGVQHVVAGMSGAGKGMIPEPIMYKGRMRSGKPLCSYA